MGYIYKITSPSGKSYVGQTSKKVQVRFNQHYAEAQRNRKKGCYALHNAMREYEKGDFVIEKLLKCDNNELNDHEIRLIKEHNTLAPNGYNLTTGGEGLKGITNETRKRMSESAKNKKFEHPRARVRGKNNELPLYIEYMEASNGKNKGYVARHPKIIRKQFSSMKYSMAEKLEQATEYLENELEKLNLNQQESDLDSDNCSESEQ